MKKLHYLWIAFLALTVMLSSCNEDSASIDVEFTGSDHGWYGDTIRFKVTVNATNSFVLKVSNNHDNQVFENNYQAGENTIDYQYIIPTDLTEGSIVSVSFSVQVEGQDKPVTVVKDIKATIQSSGDIVYHHGTVSADETWLASKTHIVDGDLYVSGCKITIEPGTVVRVQNGYRIKFSGQNTELQATGTEEAPITFTSDLTTPTAGSWGGLYFESGINTTTTLRHCKIEYAGSENGAINLYNATLTVENCEISKSGNYGVKAGSNSFVSFKDNIIKECSNYAITISASDAGSIGTGNSITSDMGIEISGGTIASGDVVWKKQTVPYVVSGDIYIKGANNPKLTINKGTTVLMKNGKRIYVGGSGTYGTLEAKGTADSMIVISSASATPQAGDWKFILFDQGTTNSLLEYCEIKYGGGDSYHGMIDIQNNAIVSIKNCKLSNSANYLIETEDSNNGFTEFTNNQLSRSSGHLINILGMHAGTIGEGNTFSSDANSGILITSGGTIYINSNSQWNKQNVAYFLEDLIIVRNNATLTIAPGAVLKFMSGKYLQIGYNDEYGRLVAVGTGAEKITFTSSSPTPQKGDWGSIRFTTKTMSDSKLENCIISYGGYSTYYKGNITVEPCGTDNPSIVNCEISYSKYFGIYKKKVNSQYGSPYLENNTIHDNDSGDIGQD